MLRLPWHTGFAPGPSSPRSRTSLGRAQPLHPTQLPWSLTERKGRGPPARRLQSCSAHQALALTPVPSRPGNMRTAHVVSAALLNPPISSFRQPQLPPPHAPFGQKAARSKTQLAGQGHAENHKPEPGDACERAAFTQILLPSNQHLHLTDQPEGHGLRAISSHLPPAPRTEILAFPASTAGTGHSTPVGAHETLPGTPNTLSAHPTRGSGGTVPAGSGRRRTGPRSNGGTPAGQAAVLAEYCSRGCATPPAIQAALQSWRGSASQGWGGRRSFCRGSGCSLQKRGSNEPKPPAPALPRCCSTSPSRRQPRGTNGNRQHYGHQGQILPDTDPASAGRSQLTQGRSGAESCGRTQHSLLN